MGVLLACVYVYNTNAVPAEARGGSWISGTGVTDDCDLPCGCWGLNAGPLPEQSVPLNPEPSLQPQLLHF